MSMQNDVNTYNIETYGGNEMSQMQRIMSRADDAGFCVSADQAILETVQTGIARNVGIMACTPAFEHAAEMFQSVPDVCLGLHATLTSEWTNLRWGPVLGADKVPSLVDENGHFLPNTLPIHERGFKLQEVLDEIQAQLDLARKRGLNLGYLDTHMRFDWLAGVEEGLARLAEREGLVFDPRVKYSPLPKVEGTFATPGERLIAQLQAAGAGTFLVLAHPGCESEEMRRLFLPGRAPGEVAKERDQDRRMFTDSKVIEYCRANGVELIRYTEAA